MRVPEITALLAGADDPGLFSAADALTRQNFGDAVYLRGVIEFSSHCDKNCRYCGLRRANAALHRYRMPMRGGGCRRSWQAAGEDSSAQCWRFTCLRRA